MTFGSGKTCAQEGYLDSFLTQQQFIKGCALYRAEVIDDITAVLVDFNLLWDEIKSLSQDLEKHEKFREIITNNLIKGFSDNEWPNSTIDYFLVGIEPESREIYMQWFKANYYYFIEYNYLVRKDFIESNYPYKLKLNTDLWEEVAFYNLRPGMTMVDIGTGSGHFPFVLALSDFGSQIYMTEIDSSSIHLLYKKLNDFPVDKSAVEIVKGTENETGLEELKADIIFLRETFHHFKYKNDMLESIKRNLKAGGFVYVKEVVKKVFQDPDNHCPQIISKKKIISSFEEAGFMLNDEKKIGKSVVMKFSLLQVPVTEL